MDDPAPATLRQTTFRERLRSWWTDHRAVARERAAALEAKAREALSLGEAQRLAMEAETLRAVADGGGRRKGIIPLLRN